MMKCGFHCHHVPARFELTAAGAAPPAQRSRREAIGRELPDEERLTNGVSEYILAGLIATPTVAGEHDSERAPSVHV